MFAPSSAGLFLDTKKSQIIFLSPVQHIKPYRRQYGLLSDRLSKQRSVIASGGLICGDMCQEGEQTEHWALSFHTCPDTESLLLLSGVQSGSADQLRILRLPLWSTNSMSW